MPASPNTWFCDVCGEQITTAEEGYVIWNIDEKHLAHDFLVIHKNKCDNGSRPSAQPLVDLIGPDGLTRMLAFLSVGPLQADDENPTTSSVANIDEFVDLMRRLHVPFYEEARCHFGNSGVHHAMSDANEYAPYLQKTLKRIADGELDD